MIKVPNHIAKLPRFIATKSNMQSANTAINMSSNENYICVFDSLIKSSLGTLHDANRYPDSNCLLLRNTLAKGTNGSADNVIVGNGSEGILSYIFKAFCEPTDEILTANGTFVGVYLLAQSFNIPCVRIPLSKEYGFNLNAILNAITEKTKIIYLSNPNNPTGTLIQRSDLEHFLAKIPKNIIVIVDEAYYEYAVELAPAYSNFDSLAFSNVITLRTFSKAYGLASIRLGYGYASATLINILMSVKLTFEPGGFTQAIGVIAKENEVLMKPIIEKTIHSLNDFYQYFESLNVHFVHSYANFVMVDLKSSELAKSVQAELLNENIQVSYLGAFGLPTCIRITVCSHLENQRFFNVFSSVYQQELSALAVI